VSFFCVLKRQNKPAERGNKNTTVQTGIRSLYPRIHVLFLRLKTLYAAADSAAANMMIGYVVTTDEWHHASTGGYQRLAIQPMQAVEIHRNPAWTLIL